MENINAQRLVAHQQSPFLSLIVFILLVIGSLLVASGIASLLLGSMVDLSQQELFEIENASEISTSTKYAILINQGVVSLFTFLLPPLLFFGFYNKINIHEMTGLATNKLLPYIIAAFILISFFLVNSFFIELNESMKLPSSFSEVEETIRDLEDQFKALTEILTSFDTPGYFALAVVVVAIIPAIGEEILFRGLLQNIFREISGNHHIAIWLAAIFFSAIHLQFYGFLPRMLLGALFGYLYVWSGNILMPMLAHFLNNFISLLLLYIYQLNLTEESPESSEALPIWAVTLFSVVLIMLCFTFYRYFSDWRKEHGKLEKGV